MKPKAVCIEVGFTDNHPKVSLFWMIYNMIKSNEEGDTLRYIRNQFADRLRVRSKLDQRMDYFVRWWIENET